VEGKGGKENGEKVGREKRNRMRIEAVMNEDKVETERERDGKGRDGRVQLRDTKREKKKGGEK